MHYWVAVIMPKDTKDVKAKINELLAPYRQTEVPEYETACSCVSSQAYLYGRMVANEQFSDGRFDSDKYWALPPGERFHDDFWREHRDVVRQAATSHPLFGKADRNCYDCRGTGMVKSTYNEKGYWDYWCVEDKFKIGPVSQLPEGVVPTRMVTPDGNWHQPVEESRIAYEQFDQEAARLYLEFNDFPVAIIDCHG